MTTVTESNILSEVMKIVESTLKMPVGKLDIDAEFESFGMDSIIMMELMTNLSKELNIAITPAQFTEVDTVKELSDSLKSSLTSSDNTSAEEIIPEIKTPSVNKSTPVKVPTEPRLSRGVQRSPRSRTTRLKENKNSFQKLLNHIKQQFAIDLTHQNFDSLDEIVDTLVSDYPSVMTSHYDIASLLKSNSSQEELPKEEVYTPHKQVTDIAIVGMSCNFPDAPNTQIFWDNLINKKNSIAEIPKSRWDWKKHYSKSISDGKTISKWGALIDDVDCFDRQFFNISSENALIMDPQERLLLQGTYQAFQDASIDIDKISGSNTGVFVGYEYCEYEQYLKESTKQSMKKNQDEPVFSSSSQTYYLANRLSYLFNFCGPSESMNINCASSAIAINRAYYSLLSNESNLAIAAGVCLNLFADDYIAGSQFGMLSPDGTNGVFDDNANGFTRGEGVGAIILKRLDDAKRDNNKIYGIIKSSHQNNRGNANDISEIKHQSITQALSDCYKKASINPDTINYIEVDGYATKWGDSFEFEGIKNVYKDSDSSTKHCALGSLKGNIGHLEPASGIASVIKIALSLYNKKFPATITKNKLNEFIDIKSRSHPLYIADKAIAFEDIRQNTDTPIRAGVNSFADSGANVHILLEEYIEKQKTSEEPRSQTSQLFILSAKDQSRLGDYVRNYIDFLAEVPSNISFNDMIYSLQVGRQVMDERLAIIASSYDELLTKLKIVNNLNLQGQVDLQDHGIFYGNLEQSKNNPLVSLITKDMGSKQVELSLQNEEWQQIAILWVNGVVLPWEKIWQPENVQRVSLPGYPFASNRYWYDPTAVTAQDDTAELADNKNVETPNDVSSALPQSYQAELTDTEKKLVAIWASAMNLEPEKIGIRDSFLEMGGDSMQATQLVSRIRSELSIDLPLIAFLDVDTLAGAAEVIDSIKYQNEQLQENDDVFEFEEGSI